MGSSRRLAAILFADIEGFTALMHADEGHADTLRQKFQQALNREVGAHEGQIISIKGDGALCIFYSSVNAVRAASVIQLEMLQEPSVPLRMGIHEADIIIDQDDVFGDGVNLASRLESFGVPGSILISETVQREIKNHPEINYAYVGKFRFKNVKEPVGVYALSNAGLVVPQKTKLKGKGQLYTNRKPVAIALAVLAVFAVAFFFYLQNFKTRLPRTKEKSIAVLPFTNISNNPSNEYFCDGITEDIITGLVKIAGLKVISRTSVMQYKNTKETIRQIAEALNVSTILEGSVQLVNYQVRITAQLIDAEKDEHLWAESYDEKFDQVLSIQNRISQKIAGSLLITLSPSEKRLIQKQNSGNAEAYNLMLQARYFRQKLGKENLEKAEERIMQALAIDSMDARLWTEAGTIYINKGDNWLGLDNYNKGETAINKALKIDTAIAEAYSSRSLLRMNYLFDWAGANEDIKKAGRLEPGSAEIMSQAALLALTLGRADEATKLAQRELELDPLNLWAMQLLASIHQGNGKPREAIAGFYKVLELQPDRAYVYANMGICYLLLKKPDSALLAVKKEQHEGLRLYGEALAYAALKNNTASEKARKELLTKFPGLVDFQIAVIYSFRDEKDQAFHWLQTAFDHRDAGLASLKYDPLLDNLRGDPRFSVLLKKLKFD